MTLSHYLYALQRNSSFAYGIRYYNHHEDFNDDENDGRDDDVSDDVRDGRKWHHGIVLKRETSVEVTKLVIKMINGVKNLSDYKQNLLKFLPLLERLQKTFPDDSVEDNCDVCEAETYSAENRLWLTITQPAWSNCTGCSMK